jgi:hypothetical protein
MFSGLKFIVFSLAALSAQPNFGAGWIRGNFGTNELVWGSKGGLLFAIPPSGFKKHEPRGLIRLGYPILNNGGYDLVNFIAIEPVVRGRKGFSELEKSKLDGVNGKRIWLISQFADANKLNVKLAVEAFDNGAEVQLEVEQSSAAPDEILLTTRATTNSTPLEFCILTATMGNMIRARELWLKDKAVNAGDLYPTYSDLYFAPHTAFAFDQLLCLDDNSVIAAITTDEADPAAAQPFDTSNFWHYRGAKVTQYWKQPASASHAGLSVLVNARHTYYGSRKAIPNGNAFENFEMRQSFRDGQQFIFGITRRTPAELGYRY